MTETKPTTSSEPISDTDYAEQMLAGKHHRGNGPQLAAFLRLVADKLATADPAVVAHLDINVLPSSHREVDVLAAAFGVEAETKQMSGGSYHRSAKAGPFHVFTSCPPPVTVQREQLLAQLADLDAQIATEVDATALMADATQQLRTSTDAPSFLAGVSALMDASQAAADAEQVA